VGVGMGVEVRETRVRVRRGALSGVLGDKDPEDAEDPVADEEVERFFRREVIITHAQEHTITCKKTKKGGKMRNLVWMIMIE
jgi:hypothetical protein